MHFTEFNSQALANSIYAFSKLEIKPTAGLIHAWEQQAIMHFTVYWTEKSRQKFW